MAAWQRTATLGAALALTLTLSVAAAAQDWVNPDGSKVGEPEPGDQSTMETDGDKEETVVGREEGADTTHLPDPDAILQPLAQPSAGFPQSAAVPIPRGHMPPPGECRIWYPDRPPGHQPPPGDCENLQYRVPPGAFLVRG